MDESKFVSKSVELGAPPERVWAALTEPALTKQYYFGCEFHSDWTPGSPVESRFEYEGATRVATQGKILAAQPHEWLELTCYTPEAANDPSQHSTLSYALASTPEGCRLDVRQGPFADAETLEQMATSCEMVLQGLKRMLAEHQ